MQQVPAVATDVLKHDDGAVWLIAWLFTKMNTVRLHTLVIAPEISGLEEQKYPATALLVALAGKFLLLVSLPTSQLIPLMILAHTISRLNAASMMLTEAYARPEGKAKPLAVRISAGGLLLAAALALAPFIWIELPTLLWLAVLPLLALRLWFAHWLRKWLGGFTGDCLGALQQLSELVFLLSALALCRFI